MKNTFVCNFPHRGLFGRTHTHSYISNAFPGPGKHRDILSAETLTEKCVGVTPETLCQSAPVMMLLTEVANPASISTWRGASSFSWE